MLIGHSLFFFFFFFFFFNDTATTEIYTLSLHDALPISAAGSSVWIGLVLAGMCAGKASCRESIQPIAKGSGASARTSARPTWPAPKRRREVRLSAGSAAARAARRSA